MDFLVKYDLSPRETLDLISKILECSHEDISFLHLDVFNELIEDPSKEKTTYLCVFFDVQGDASKILQIYRANLDTDELTRRTVASAQQLNISCYIPIDDFDKWLYIDKDKNVKYVKQIECNDENFYFFKEIK